MYSTYGSYGNNLGSLTAGTSSGVWSIVALILAIIGSILAYFLFVKPSKEYPSKFVNWLRSFLNFGEMLIEPILKVTYMFFAIYITLGSFSLISYDFLTFLLVLLLGNLLTRVIYEAAMMTVGIWKNTKEIKKKMK